MDELPLISKENEGNWEEYDPLNPPAWLIDCPFHDQPNKIIHPMYSHVVQIRASEVVSSTVYGAGMTLRFPRFIKIRDDKLISEALTLNQAKERYLQNKGKMVKGIQSNSHSQITQIKKKRIAPIGARVRKELTAPDTKKEGSLFQDAEFCVSSSVSIPKNKVEKLILSNGGKVVQNPMNSTQMIIGDTKGFRISFNLRLKDQELHQRQSL